MGIYYAVANYTKKEFLWNPSTPSCDEYGVKWRSIFDPEHILARLVLYKIHDEWSADKIALVQDDPFPWHIEDMWIDVTQNTVNEYIEAFDKYPECVKGFTYE